MLPPAINVGLHNFIMVDHIQGVLDARTPEAKRIVDSARADNPRKVLNLCYQRKRQSLLVLTGDRYVLSFVPRVNILRRMGVFDLKEDNE